MMNVEHIFTISILFALLIITKSEVYIVTIEGDPVISYRGGIDGFEATAVESDQKLDVTRLFIVLKIFFIYRYSLIQVWN